jgi:rhamnosyltransferase
MNKIVAIITSFNPNLEILKFLLKAIEHQVAHIVIVDNGTSKKEIRVIKQFIPDNCILIENEYNFGVSEAINRGVLEAKKLCASYLVVFDQDSRPAQDMIEQLLSVMMHNKKKGKKVAAAGPKYTDVKGYETTPFTRLDGRRLKKITCSDYETVFVGHLITSGCFIAMDALDDVGYMDPGLFIDYVDTEWCLRATNKGYMLLGVGAAKMQHDLGDDVVEFCGRTIPVHSALRNYYLIRNGIWMLWHPLVSGNWKLMNMIRLLKIYIILSLFIGPRFRNWRMMTIGIWHGIIGKMGKYKE